MDDISRELRMSKKTLYQYVKNKEELIHLIIEAHIELDKEINTDIHKSSKDAISEMFGIAKHVLETLSKLPSTTIYDLQKYYPKSWQLVEAFHEQFIFKSIKKNLERGVKEKLYRPEIDCDVIAKLYVGKSTIVADESIFPSKEYNKEDLFKTYFLYHIHGIATEKGIKKVNKHLEQVAKKKLSKTQK